jgi:hypothetical protein
MAYLTEVARETFEDIAITIWRADYRSGKQDFRVYFEERETEYPMFRAATLKSAQAYFEKTISDCKKGWRP